MKDTLTESAELGALNPLTRPALVAKPAVAGAEAIAWDTTLESGTRPISVYRDMIKRAIDITLIVLSTPLWLPLVAICAAVLWMEGGNPFYTQQRWGQNGKAFRILKLRTMVRNADEVLESYLAANPAKRREWDELQKLRNDPRVTPVGAFLRKTSLDELPQLLNVLTGSMSLVGPRPMMLDQLALYGDPTAYFALKPGITGLWQVSARNATRFSYRNEVGALYAASLSISLDFSILFKTIGVVLRPTGH